MNNIHSRSSKLFFAIAGFFETQLTVCNSLDGNDADDDSDDHDDEEHSDDGDQDKDDVDDDEHDVDDEHDDAEDDSCDDGSVQLQEDLFLPATIPMKG